MGSGLFGMCDRGNKLGFVFPGQLYDESWIKFGGLYLIWVPTELWL